MHALYISDAMAIHGSVPRIPELIADVVSDYNEFVHVANCLVTAAPVELLTELLSIGLDAVVASKLLYCSLQDRADGFDLELMLEW